MLIVSEWERLELGDLDSEENYNLEQLIIIYPIIFEYVLVSLTIICFASCFKKLKRYDEKGLFCGLIGGLIWGLIWGLIDGLVFGLFCGLVFGLIVGLVFGLIVGLVFGF